MDSKIVEEVISRVKTLEESLKFLSKQEINKEKFRQLLFMYEQIGAMIIEISDWKFDVAMKKILLSPKQLECNHEFESDGGPCKKCHKTWNDLVKEKSKGN